MRGRIPLVMWSILFYVAGQLAAGSGPTPWYQVQMPQVSVVSGDTITMTLEHVHVAVSLVLSLFDVIAVYSERTRSLLKHACTFCLFVICVVLFLTVHGFGNAGFLIYTLIVLCDLTAGLLLMVAITREAHRRADECE